MKNKTDLYKIKFVNSALKHNIITNTYTNMKPRKYVNCELKLG